MNVEKYPIKIKCTICNKMIDAELHIQQMQIIDSPGIFLFADGAKCDICLELQTGLNPNSLVDVNKKGELEVLDPEQ